MIVKDFAQSDQHSEISRHQSALTGNRNLFWTKGRDNARDGHPEKMTKSQAK